MQVVFKNKKGALMKRVWILMLISFFLINCDVNSSFYEGRVFYLSSEDKDAMVSNELFRAILDRKNLIEIQDIINENGNQLFSINAYGDTPLGAAIKTYNEEAARYLISLLPPKHLQHRNHRGESYVYLAAEQGYADIVNLLSDEFYNSFILFSDYEFSDLDQETLDGDRALHISKNEAVAESLKYQYYRAVDVPIRKFEYHLNEDDQSFLHTAVRDSRTSTLKWGVSQNCTDSEKWNRYSTLFFKTPLYIWKGLNHYSPVLIDNLINTKDKDGNTPINLAAKYLVHDSIRVLANCMWVDYLEPNEEGDIPLQTFLKNLDPFLQKHSDKTQETFTLLVESRTRFTLKGIRDHVDYIDANGDSSLHLAARIYDRFFYDYLKKYGSIEQKNQENRSPKVIFTETQKKLLGAG